MDASNNTSQADEDITARTRAAMVFFGLECGIDLLGASPDAVEAFASLFLTLARESRRRFEARCGAEMLESEWMESAEADEIAANAGREAVRLLFGECKES